MAWEGSAAKGGQWLSCTQQPWEQRRSPPPPGWRYRFVAWQCARSIMSGVEAHAAVAANGACRGDAAAGGCGATDCGRLPVRRYGVTTSWALATSATQRRAATRTMTSPSVGARPRRPPAIPATPPHAHRGTPTLARQTGRSRRTGPCTRRTRAVGRMWRMSPGSVRSSAGCEPARDSRAHLGLPCMYAVRAVTVVACRSSGSG